MAIVGFDKFAGKVLRNIPDKVDNYLAEIFMPDKFWLHRVNSIEKQKEFSKKYAGLEFDIIFHSEIMGFENSHDHESFERYNFEKQLEVYQNLENKNGMWLDFKNLGENNKIDSLAVLKKLVKKYDVDKNKIWVESSNWQALRIFKNAGFKTSYYFPYYNFSKMSDSEIKDAKRKTEMIAKSGNVDAISFYGGYYDFVRQLELPPVLYCCLGQMDKSGWKY